jgi:hypothetical protein
VSDSLVQIIVTAVCGVLTAAITGYVAIQLARLNLKQATAAVEAKKVAEKLEVYDATSRSHLSHIAGQVMDVSGQVSEVAGQVTEVHRTTNGLVAKLEQVAFDKGVKSGQDSHMK